jgi:sugar lactone lactonase YvrE
VLTTVAEGLAFGEGPRWHDGALWLSDMHGHRVHRVEADGTLTTVLEVPRQPSGLGWLPGGDLLVVSMVDRRVLRVDSDGAVTTHADLMELAPWHCNDMVVDGRGFAYVGNFGFDLYAEGAADTPKPTTIVVVEPDGSARVAADNVRFPNGTVITPDGHTLIVGESFGGCLTAFDIAGDGTLTNRRLWAQLTDAVPDGICLDASGAVWVASPISHEALRVAEGGEVLERVPVEGKRQAFACMLGGPDGRTLYVLTASTSVAEKCKERRDGRVEAVEVDVPGAGWP